MVPRADVDDAGLVARGERIAGGEAEIAGEIHIGEGVAEPAGGEQVGVGSEGEFVDEVAADLVADVEAGVGFFGADVLPVLDDAAGRGAAVAADGGGVVDGMRVRVGAAEGDAAAHALAGADGERVEIGEGERVFVVVGNGERWVVDGGGQRGGRTPSAV